MGDNGIRARLAYELYDELDEHGYEDDDEKRWQVAYHFADAVLSLPDIAVVKLPEPNLVQDTYQSWRFFEAGEIEYVSWPSKDDDEINVSGVGSYTLSETKTFAAALLAAANAAEADHG